MNAVDTLKAGWRERSVVTLPSDTLLPLLAHCTSS